MATLLERVFKAKLLRVIDGDTVELQVDLGFYVSRIDRFRLAGVDTPEHSAGVAARDYLTELLSQLDEWFEVRVTKADKYGRWLVVIPLRAASGKTANQTLIDMGFARVYDGGKK